MQEASVVSVAVLASLLSTAGIVLAGRPLTIDDADPVDPGQFEFEAGAAYEHDSDCRHWDFPFGLAYGLVRDVEVGVGFGGQLEERTEVHEENGTEDCIQEHSIGDLVIAAKWRMMEPCPLGARHALIPSVKLPTASDDDGLGSGEPDGDLTWIASRPTGDKTGMHLNLGYSWIGGPDDDVLHGGVALDCQIADAVQWVGEVFAEKELAGGEDAVAQYSTGFRWNPLEGLTLDIAGGSTISGEAPDVTGTVGVTWAFGFGHGEGK